MYAMAYKTKYLPENVTKYMGNPTKIVCRSTWERKMCKYLDNNVNVLRWASEELSIPYLSPVDNKMHKYYPDFIAEVRTKTGDVKTFLIEVKPYKQTKPPVIKKRKTKSYDTNMKMYAVNEAKWEAAKKLCNDNQWEFTILTENELFKGKQLK
jgi:hypothetical protein|tara:strand:+ start:1366 stop:1824 length:459 start_codon:yes stop_codon:yes gene_type:complete